MTPTRPPRAPPEARPGFPAQSPGDLCTGWAENLLDEPNGDVRHLP